MRALRRSDMYSMSASGSVDTFSLQDCDVIGFDLDHTLCRYDLKETSRVSAHPDISAAEDPFTITDSVTITDTITTRYSPVTDPTDRTYRVHTYTAFRSV